MNMYSTRTMGTNVAIILLITHVLSVVSGNDGRWDIFSALTQEIRRNQRKLPIQRAGLFAQRERDAVILNRCLQDEVIEDTLHVLRPIITAPQQFQIGKNNSVWIIPFSSQLMVQMFFVQRGSPIEHENNCYELNYDVRRNRLVSNGAEEMKILFQEEFLPAHFIPGARYRMELVVRWRDNINQPWFEERKPIRPVSPHKVFIQTDKPVYKVDQTVTIRIYTVDGSLKPTSHDIRVQVASPSGTVFQHEEIDANDNEIPGLFQTTFEFPVAAELGAWRILVNYGTSFLLQTKTDFEVQDYKLPTFSVVVSMPNIIQDHTRGIVPITATTRHVFGENAPVHGSMECFAAVSNSGLFHPDTFHKWPRQGERLCTGQDGTVNLTLDMSVYSGNAFGLRGEQLQVYCNVTEYFTDVQASGVAVATFADKLYDVNFDRSPSFYSPGLPYVFQADILRQLSGSPASEVSVNIGVIRMRTQETLWESETSSNKHGRLLHVIDISEPVQDPIIIEYCLCNEDSRSLVLEVGVSPVYQKWLLGKGSITRFIRHPVILAVNGNEKSLFYHELSALPPPGIRLVPQFTNGELTGVTVRATAFWEVKQLFFIYASNGQVLHQEFRGFQMFPRSGYLQSLRLMPTMFPTLDIIVFYIKPDSENPVLDTLTIPIEYTCNELETIFTNKSIYAPQEMIEIDFLGFANSVVAPLMVDNAALLLGKYGRITDSLIKESLARDAIQFQAGDGLEAALHFDLNFFGALNSNLPLRKRRSIYYVAEDVELQNIEDCCEFKANERELACDELVTELIPKAAASGLGQACVNEAYHCCKRRQEALPIHSGRESNSAGPREPDMVGRHAAAVELPIFIDEERPLLAKAPVSDQNTDLHSSGEHVDSVPSEFMVRKIFPESIVLPVAFIGNKLRYRLQQPAPDSITSWNIHAVYLNPTTGMCLPEARNIHVLQDMFIRVDAPHKVVRGEHFEINVILHNRANASVVNITLDEVGSGLCYTTAKVSHSLTVSANSRGYRHWYFKAIEIGDQMITVSARNIQGNVLDSMLVNVEVVAEGITKTEKLHSVVTHPEPTSRNISVNHRGRLSIPRRQNAVRDSQRTIIKFSGNVMDVNVDMILSNVKGTAKAARKTARHVLKRMSSTFYASWYLKTSNLLNVDTARKIRRHLRKSVKDLKSFRERNGSFKHTASSNSSLWLTVSAIRLLNGIAREFPAYADTHDLICSGAAWIFNKSERGVFHEDAADTPRKARDPLVLTALASLALYDLGCGEEQTIKYSEKVARDSLQHLSMRYRNADDYAKTHIGKAFMTHNYGQSGIFAADLDRISSVIMAKNHEEVDSSDVEQMSNVMMAMYLNPFSHWRRQRESVDWLLQRRNQDGEFILTEDTVAGLEALAHAAARMRTNPGASVCAVVPGGTDVQEHNIAVEQLTTYYVDVTHMGEDIQIFCLGQIPALLEVFVQYNTLHPAHTCDFNVNASAVKRVRGSRGKRSTGDVCYGDESERNGNSYIIEVCIEHWKNEPLRVDTEVQLLSGHAASEQSLELLRKEPCVQGCDHNHDWSAVFMQMSVTSHTKTCVSIYTREPRSKIDNYQPASVTVQDQNSGMMCRALYGIDSEPAFDDPQC